MSHFIQVVRRDAPLLVSFPHTGTELVPEVEGKVVSRGRALNDTDWFIHDLYDFVAALGATTVRTALSRTVIDVNRDPSGVSLYPGQATTDLCPITSFDGDPIYRDGLAPDAAEIARRKDAYFTPYHEALSAEIQRLKDAHGQIVLYDCHSIRGLIPRLFEGQLPDFNIGTNSGASCSDELTAIVEAACAASPFTHVVNGRFKGGWITRHYGQPEDGVHAIQMELAISGYMVEPGKDEIPESLDRDRALPMRAVLEQVMNAALAFAKAI